MEKNIESTKPFYLQKSFRKIHILAVLSVIGLVITFILLNRISVLANEIKEAKHESASEADLADYAFLESEIEHYQQQIDELNSLFASDSEIINFVQEIDRLKREGVVQSFSFVSNTPIIDKSGNLGIPISITLSGNEEQIDAALRNIQSLPFLLRGVQTEVSKETNEEGVETTILEYGGFLYVEEPKTN
jgi:Tfp pilus assembly protein PilO